jgi:glutamate formiminotransferase
MKLIECVPNFSEGRDGKKVEEIVRTASEVRGVRILDFSLDEDHNRSVLTFVGSLRDVEEGALAACRKALDIIDMRNHNGVHPRIGAVDVVPFIPLARATMEDAIQVAHGFGYAFGEENNIPVYFYGAAALRDDRKGLAQVRKGQYEGLEEKLVDPFYRPDAGPARFNPRGGATAVGARKPLVAFNVNLDSDDLVLAKDIAKSIRYSNGGLKHVMAMGVLLAGRKRVQVSMNLTDYEVTSPRRVFDVIRKMAAARGVSILESEIIGLIPQGALADATANYLKVRGFRPEMILESHIQ